VKERHLRGLLRSDELLDQTLAKYLDTNALKNVQVDETKVQGHTEKAAHNLKFTENTLQQGYTDWALVGCYYSAYHIALALILRKGLKSENHDATLCALIKYYYRKELTAQELAMLNSLYLDDHDILFYVQSKQERKNASYSSEREFSKAKVNDIILKTRLFVKKCRDILT